MPTYNSILTPQVPKTDQCVLTTASTDIDDVPSASVLLATAAVATRFKKITVKPRTSPASAACMLLYLSKDGGTTQRLIGSCLVNGNAISATTDIQIGDFGYNDTDNSLELEAGDRLYAATMVALAGGYVVFAQRADY